MKRVDVTVYYLAMQSPEHLRPKPERVDLRIARAELPLPELSRFLYAAVGGPWYWIDRLGWRYSDWKDWLEKPGIETWIGYHRGTPVGYYELQPGDPETINIAYFGLLPAFVGRGFGGTLLTHAVTRAWQLEPTRVTLNTCSLDHPHALANYQARGFRIYREATEVRHLPDQPPGPWPGAAIRQSSAKL